MFCREPRHHPVVIKEASLKTYICRMIFGVLVVGLIAASPTMAGDTMPAAQQNELVKKYCAVCHNDTQLNAGLSVEHFDAAHADPSVAAMLLSKLTSGLPLDRVSAANVDPAAAA